MKTSSEYQAFDKAMGTILRANPDHVKAAMEADKREREITQRLTGKRGRGRPPKSSASSRASSEKD
jgi:hypothetical protein